MPLANSFNPNEMAFAALLDVDFDIESLVVYRNLIPIGFNRKEIKKLRSLPNSDEVIENMTTTFRRLVKNRLDGGNPDFKANLKNTIGGTITTHIIDQFSEEDAKRIQIKWIPSSAENADPYHMRFYGKTMSLYRARHLGLGNSKYASQRGYGCQCGCQIISNINLVKKRNDYK